MNIAHHPSFRGVCGVITALLTFASVLYADLPPPLVHLPFAEGAGSTSANTGSLGGGVSFADVNGRPAFSTSVPTGTYAPLSNGFSVDFGQVADGEGGWAADLLPSGEDTSLGGMDAFTICGWVNARQLNEGFGGNRIAFALDSPAGSGFDLVQLGNGALRLGVNDWPDGPGNAPASPPGKITADPAGGASNWVFFAVVYDSSAADGRVTYYFGSGESPASISGTYDYPQGPVLASGGLTVGNFSEIIAARTGTGNGGSRVFRGLIDELRVFNSALDASQVQEAQYNGPPPQTPVVITAQPSAVSTVEGGSAIFSVEHTGSAPFTYQWQRNGTDIPGATSKSYTLSPVAAADDGAKFRVTVGNAVTPGVLSAEATLHLVPADGPAVSLSFSDGGLSVTNRGVLGGSGAYVVRDGYPVASTKVPSGPQAPPNNSASVDFGIITAGQGGRAIDLSNPIDNTLGSFDAFTVTGWLNCADLDAGFGGNRIVFALDGAPGPGFDLVQTGNGELRLGVNDWPDGPGSGPVSSGGMIPADPDLGSENWIFFAVTYDSTLESDQVAYYFGSPSTAAAPDITATYEQGPIESSGAVTIGNFGTVAGARTGTGPGGPSRVFRGLIDEVNVFRRALTLEEIRTQQTAPAFKPDTDLPVAILTPPANVTVFEGSDAVFEVVADGTPPVTYQWWKRRDGVETEVAGANASILELPALPLTAGGDEYRVVVTNPVSSESTPWVTLTVLAENNLKVAFAFSEDSGLTTANTGNLGGNGALVVIGDYPAFSPNVPFGPFTPGSNTGSIDFGTIQEGEGGRAINLEGGVFGDEAGAMSTFTITGWLNCRQLEAGSGGNRIICAHDFSADPGFDLVQNVDGTLQLGVNSWPDFPVVGPLSSPVVTEDPEAGPGNWIFFAVTYDGTVEFGNVVYYFGSPNVQAAEDTVADYPQGRFFSTGAMTIGNLNTADNARNATGSASRNFRGLLDELRVVNRVLTLAEIRTIQSEGNSGPPPAVDLTVVRDGNQIVLTWTSGGTLRVQGTETPATGPWNDESAVPVVNGETRTLTLPISAGRRFYRLVQ